MVLPLGLEPTVIVTTTGSSMQHTWVARAGGAAGAADRISPDGVARALGSSLRAFCARTHRSSAFMSPRLLSHKGLASYDSASAGGTRARLEKRAAARKRHGMTRTGMGATLRQRRVAIGDQGNLLCNFAGVPTHHSNYGRHQPGDRRPRGRDAGATAAIAFQGGHNRLSGQAFCRTLRRRRFGGRGYKPFPQHLQWQRLPIRVSTQLSA